MGENKKEKVEFIISSKVTYDINFKYFKRIFSNYFKIHQISLKIKIYKFKIWVYKLIIRHNKFWLNIHFKKVNKNE